MNVIKKGQKLSKHDTEELTGVGGSDFVITSAVLDSDNLMIKRLISDGGTIEYAKRVRLEHRGINGVLKRDLIFINIPLKTRKPTIEGLSFCYIVYINTGVKAEGRARTIVNFGVKDLETNRAMLFGPKFELTLRMNHDFEVRKEDVEEVVAKTPDFLSKLDRFLVSIENDVPKNFQIKRLNRELIGVMLRTARRTTEVINIDSYNKAEGLIITDRLAKYTWSSKVSKLQLWRIAFNNVFDIELVNSLGIEYSLDGKVSVMTRKYKGDESISGSHEIAIMELIARSLLFSLITSENFEDTVIPIKFDINNFL
jgi:hypothetical protein